MEFVAENGNTLIAKDDVQASAFRNAGMKEVKPEKEAKPAKGKEKANENEPNSTKE